MGGGREHIGRWWETIYQITVFSVRLGKLVKFARNLILRSMQAMVVD